MIGLPHKQGLRKCVDYNDNHMEETYSGAVLMTALYVAGSVSFWLPHAVAVSIFIICRGLCVCGLRYYECVCCM